MCQDSANYKSVVTAVPIVSLKGPPLTRLSPSCERLPIKFVKDAFSADQCPSVPPVESVPSAAGLHPVGSWLQRFWQAWAQMSLSQRVVSILREACMLPLKIRPRHPLIRSGYANALGNRSLKETLHLLLQKQVLEKVKTQYILAFYNKDFLVPKPKVATHLGSQCLEPNF